MGTSISGPLPGVACPVGWGPAGLYRPPQPGVVTVYAEGLVRTHNYDGDYPPKPTGPYNLTWLTACSYVHYFRSPYQLTLEITAYGWWVTFADTARFSYSRWFHDAMDPYLLALPYIPRYSATPLWSGGLMTVLYSGTPR